MTLWMEAPPLSIVCSNSLAWIRQGLKKSQKFHIFSDIVYKKLVPNQKLLIRYYISGFKYVCKVYEILIAHTSSIFWNK